MDGRGWIAHTQKFPALVGNGASVRFGARVLPLVDNYLPDQAPPRLIIGNSFMPAHMPHL
jgi:hypothetical protein